MAITLHRCGGRWIKMKAHACWRVEKALQDQGIEYEPVYGPLSRRKRDELERLTGQRLFPAIVFEDGSTYREESKEMERTIRAGRLEEKRTGPVAGTA